MTSRKWMGLIGSVVLVIACGAPDPSEIAGWDASDETNAAQIDHGAWQELLDSYVRADDSGVNLFDYAAIAANAGDTAKLSAYIDYLQGHDSSEYSRAEQMAFWINLYNAVTVQVVLSEYPVDSIKEIHEGVIPNTGPWQDPHAQVNGRDLSLDDIEHGILRPLWRDKRIHYARELRRHRLSPSAGHGLHRRQHGIAAGAGCTRLREHPARCRLRRRGLHRHLEHLSWYAEDFGNTEESVVAHLVDYADEELAARLDGFEGSIDYEYDWSLNEP